MRILLSSLFLALGLFGVFSVASAAFTINKSCYEANEDVILTDIDDSSNNIWLYPYDTAADCRYYGTFNCATGASTQTGNLPMPLQNDGGNEQTFGTAVVLGNNTYTLVETTSGQDCGSASLATCQMSGGYLDEIVFEMSDDCSGGGGSTSTLPYDSSPLSNALGLVLAVGVATGAGVYKMIV